MKNFCAITAITVFLQFCLNGVQAQTVTTNLDQIKLGQVWVGTWQHEKNKDTLEVVEIQRYGNAFLSDHSIVINGKKSLQFTESYGISSEEGTYKGFVLLVSGDYITWLGSFTTENKFCADIVQNFNPATVEAKWEFEFETPINYTATLFSKDGEKIGAWKWTKVK